MASGLGVQVSQVTGQHEGAQAQTEGSPSRAWLPLWTLQSGEQVRGGLGKVAWGLGTQRPAEAACALEPWHLGLLCSTDGGGLNRVVRVPAAGFRLWTVTSLTPTVDDTRCVWAEAEYERDCRAH